MTGNEGLSTTDMRRLSVTVGRGREGVDAVRVGWFSSAKGARDKGLSAMLVRRMDGIEGTRKERLGQESVAGQRLREVGRLWHAVTVDGGLVEESMAAVDRVIGRMESIVVVRAVASVVRVCCEVETWKRLIEVKLVHIDCSGGVDDGLAVIGLHHVDLVVLALCARGLFLDHGLFVAGARRGVSFLLLLGLAEDLLEAVWTHIVVLRRILPVGVDGSS